VCHSPPPPITERSRGSVTHKNLIFYLFEFISPVALHFHLMCFWCSVTCVVYLSSSLKRLQSLGPYALIDIISHGSGSVYPESS
jgi:hypothetical protein